MIRTMALMVGAVLSLTACTAAFLDTASYGVFQEQDVNLAEKNYAAADYLIQQADTFVMPYHLIRPVRLTDLQNPQVTSRLGNVIPEQVGVRLSQLGYRIDLAQVATSPDVEFLRPADLKEDEAADYNLSGTYLRNRNSLDINLRLVDRKNNRVVAAFNYDLPLNRTIAALMEPQPRAFTLP